MFDAVRFASAIAEDGHRSGVSFFASVDGAPVHCFITAGALESYFGAPPTALESSFVAHRSEIEEVAATLISVRGIQSGELTIGLSELESSLVAFGRSINPSAWPPYRPPLKG